uniref:URB1 C-terminal domain-containing protein n=1 Tax=Picocystis salinarum TaxID=88271 RepID=A0A7S3XDI8_9CHLO|mmetsp:Transcript_3864/g.24507  ORF Transcript_3864/g.24507 Transcript_3864/m.24507 type:complete len:1593 (+) Transcript_3864:1868-6646(+)
MQERLNVTLSMPSFFSTLLPVLSKQHKTTAISAVENLCIELLNSTGLFGGNSHLPLICINSLVALGSKDAIASSCEFFSGVLSSTLKLTAPDRRLQVTPSTDMDHRTYHVLQLSQCCLSNLVKVNDSEKINIMQKTHITAFVALLHVELLQYSNCQGDVASLIINKLDGKECFHGKPSEMIEYSIISLYKYLLARARWTQVMFGDECSWPAMEKMQSLSSTDWSHHLSLVLSEKTISSLNMKLLLLLSGSPSDVKDVLQKYPRSYQEQVTVTKFLQGYFRLHAAGNSTELLSTFLQHHLLLADPHEYGGTLGKRSFEQCSAQAHPSNFDLSSTADIPTCVTLLLTSEPSNCVFTYLWENVHFKMRDLHPNDASSIVGSMGFWLQLTLRHSSFSDARKCYSIHALFDILEYAFSYLYGKASVHLDSLLIDGIWQRIQLQAESRLTVYSVLLRRLSSVLQNIQFTSTEHSERSLCLLRLAQGQLLGLLESSKVFVSQDVQSIIESLLDILSFEKSACLQQFWAQIIEKKTSKNFYLVAVSFLSKIFMTGRLSNSFVRFLDQNFLDTVVDFLDKAPTQEAEKCVCSVLSWVFSSDWELRAIFWDRHLGRLYTYCTVGPFTKSKTELFVVMLENFPIVPGTFAAFLSKVLKQIKGDFLLHNVSKWIHTFALPTVVCLHALKPGSMSGEETHVISLVEECLAAFLLKLNKSTHLGISTRSFTCLLDVIQEAHFLLPHSKVLENFVLVIPRLVKISTDSGISDLQQKQIWIQFGQLYKNRGKQRLGCELHKVLEEFCKFLIVYLKGEQNRSNSRKASHELCFVGVEICQHLRDTDKFVCISCHCMASLSDSFQKLLRIILQCAELCSVFTVFAKELLDILDLSSTNAQTKSNLLRMSWECATKSGTFMQLIVEHDEDREQEIAPQANASSPVPLDLAPEILSRWNLSTNAENHMKKNSRTCCLLFLLTMAEKIANTGSPWKPSPSTDFFTALLSSYYATTCEEDLLLLSVLQCLDSAWGGGYFERHQFQFGRHVQSSSSGEPVNTVTPLLDLIDAQRAAMTMLWFPLDTSSLDVRHCLSCSASSSKNTRIDGGRGTHTRDSNFVYDPSFLLQIVQHRLKGGERIYELAKCGLVGIALAATSSKDKTTRELAYNCLSNMMDSLEREDFKEKTQLSLMLIHVKNSIPESFYKVPSLFSLFWANCSVIVLHPEHWMYPEINRYFLKSAVEDFNRVPLFFKMVHSGKVSQSEERKWMLFLINFGLRSHEDGACLRKQFGIELILALGMSSLCDDKTKMQVLNIVRRATQVEGVATDLVEHSGLIPWLGQVFQQCCCQVETGFGDSFSGLRHEMIVCVLDILVELTLIVTERVQRPSVFSVICMQLLEVSNAILVSSDCRHTSNRPFPRLLCSKIAVAVHGVLVACSKEQRSMPNISRLLFPRALLHLLQIAQDDQALQIVVLIPVEAYGCCSAFTILLENILEIVNEGGHFPDVGNLLNWLARSAPACNTPKLARGLARASLHVFSSRPHSMQTTSLIQNAIVTLLPALRTSHNSYFLQAVNDLAKTSLPSTMTSQSSCSEQLGCTLRSVVSSIDWASIKEL